MKSLSIVFILPKPRNPVSVGARLRPRRPHATRHHDRRQQLQRELKREIADLHPPSAP